MEETKELEIIIPDTKKVTEAIRIVKRGLIKYWDKTYINERIREVENHKDKMLLIFLWYTGVRITEAITIEKRNIDFNNTVITIRWLKNRKYKERIIPLHNRIKDILQLYTATMKQDDLIFPYTRQYAWRVTTKHLGGSPHKFRHSFAVNWLRSGGDIVTLKHILGHAHINTTMQYLKIVPIDQAKELNKISFD